jgi:CheY-like chemotaxis protein
LREASSDRERLASIRLEFHGFSGLGGTYGFPEVSALGREGERLCDAATAGDPASPATPSSPFEKWERILVEIRRELGLELDEENPRVLAVSDDPVEGSALRAVLEMAGYGLRLVSSSADLPSELASFRPDLVLFDGEPSDAAGGQGDGIGIDVTRRIPILILSSLLRPIEPSALISAVAARIEKARGAR